MSRLSELIAELCPDGVEYKALGELGASQKGVRVVRKQLEDRGAYPVYQNSLTPLGYYAESNRVADMPFVIGAGAAAQIGYSDVDWWAADDCFTFNIAKDVVMGKFMFYCLLNQQRYLKSRVRKASIPRLARSVVERLRIPVPPIEVQREVVRILDEYTAAHDELVRQLEEERTIRISERTTIIREEFAARFGDPCSKDSSFDRLGEHCRVVTGNTPSRSHPEYFGEGIDWIKSDNIHPDARMLDTAKEQLSTAGEIAARVAEPGWLLMICIAGSPNTIGNTSMVDRRVAYNQQINGIDPLDVNPRYLQCALTLAKQKIERTLKPAVTCILNKRELESLLLPFPPREQQDEFAMILEKLDLAGFPEYIDALQEELTLRERQLTLVRNQLLSFPEKKAV